MSTLTAKILIVDDSEDIRLAHRTILTAAGYTIHEAEDGAQALALVPKIQPDLIICDLSMPEMDGIDVLETLMGTPEMASIPLVFITGVHNDRMRDRAMALGAKRYLVKPVPKEDLLKVVHETLAAKG
jgi:CheY-like chemotaxis protein